MRAFLFLIVLLSTYYIAAVFRFAPLLILCLAEGAALAALLLSVRILRRKLRVSLEERSGEAVRGAERTCTVRVENPTVLPAARLELRLASRWLWEVRDGVLFLYGGAEHGTARLSFRLRAAHCGLLLLRLDRVRVYDWLCLFHGSRKMGEELRLAVYPEPAALRLRLAGSDWDGGGRSTDRPGDDSGEVLKIREYQPGDSLRRVHWNQSARTDRLWMKEFPREADRRVHVLLEPGQWDSPWAADGFWQVLYSLALGLLDVVTVIRFHWLDGGTSGAGGTGGNNGNRGNGGSNGNGGTGGNAAPQSFDAADVEQVRELFVTLYRALLPGLREQTPAKRRKAKKTRTKKQRTGEQAGETPSVEQAGEMPSGAAHPPDPRLLEQIPQGDRFLRLTGDLRLWAEGSEVLRFSGKDLTDQIRAAKLEL